MAGLKGHFHCAEKKGYSGVGLYARDEPSDVLRGIGDADFDAEGRWVEVRFDRLHGRATLGGARRLQHRQLLFPERLERRDAPGGQVPLPGADDRRTCSGSRRARVRAASAT